MAACGRWDGARHVVHSDNAARRHYARRQQARIQPRPGGAVPLQPQPRLPLSLAMLYAGIAILRNALWAILLLPLLLLMTQRELIEREERYLERTFGEEYLAYKRMVRRWV